MNSSSKNFHYFSRLFLCFVFLQSIAIAQPNLIFINGRVWTENEKSPWAEAVAVSNNKIVAVGKTAQIKKLAAKDSKIINLGGRLLIPGFNDAHTHFLGGSLDLTEVSLTGARSLELMQKRVSEFARQHSNDPWITGAGWEYSYFPNQQLPTRAMLDAVVADRPVYLRAYDGHTGWANTKALQLAGITKATKFDGFGEIVRDENGEPTGVLKESAQGLVRRLIPELSHEKKLNALCQGMKLAASLGITSFQNASGNAEELSLYQELLERGELTVRASIAFSTGASLTPELLSKMVALKEKYQTNPMLRASAVKFVLDGVIESHTAAMIDPYSDAPELRGTPSLKAETYNNLVKQCSKAGFQIYTHAIGDRAVQMALDAYEKIQSGIKNLDLRSRVEHIETVSAVDLLRFGKMGVLASMEPIHADPDTIDVWAKAVGTERVKRAFPWNELKKSGAKLVFSSDWPATISVDPIRGLHNAVNRKTTDGNPVGGWIPEQRVTIEQAVSAYTSAGAFASFEEKIKGKIMPGMLADFVILSADLFTIDPLKIHETKVVMTLFNGKVIYQDKIFLPADSVK